MRMLELPCLKDKCILLPACKNKPIIECDILLDTVYQYEQLYDLSCQKKYDEVLDILHKTFNQSVFRICGKTKYRNEKRVYHIYRNWMTTSKVYYDEVNWYDEYTKESSM